MDALLIGGLVGLVAGFTLTELFHLYRRPGGSILFLGFLAGFNILPIGLLTGDLTIPADVERFLKNPANGPITGFVVFTAAMVGMVGGYGLSLYLYHSQDDEDKQQQAEQIPAGDKLVSMLWSWWKRRQGTPDDSIRLGQDQDTKSLVEVPMEAWQKGSAVFGSTGSGKTNTLKVIARQVLEKDLPLVYLDAKPDPEIRTWLRRQCQKRGRDFKVFDPTDASSDHYNFLRYGDIDNRVDKILDLFDYEGEARIYGDMNRNYLTEIFRTFKHAGATPDLTALFDLCLDQDNLLEYVEEELPEELIPEQHERISTLKQSDVQVEIGTLARSEWSELTRDRGGGIDLVESLGQRGAPVVLFSLAGLSHGSSAERLGQVIIRDVKSATEHLELDEDLQRFLMIDEFHKLAEEPTADLLTMGRSYGLCTVLSTQEPTDVGAGDEDLLRRIIGNANVRIVHRLAGVKEAREMLAEELGTRDVIKKTRQYDPETGDELLGTKRQTKEFRVHPDEFRDLDVGEAIIWSGETQGHHRVKVPLIEYLEA